MGGLKKKPGTLHRTLASGATPVMGHGHLHAHVPSPSTLWWVPWLSSPPMPGSLRPLPDGRRPQSSSSPSPPLPRSFLSRLPAALPLLPLAKPSLGAGGDFFPCVVPWWRVLPTPPRVGPNSPGCALESHCAKLNVLNPRSAAMVTESKHQKSEKWGE